MNATGCVLRDFSKVPSGTLTFAPKYHVEPIPRSEWRDRIDAKKKSKSRISDIMAAHGVPVINQNPIGWCWGFGCTNGVMASRATANLPFVHLSPSSICGPVANYQDVGKPIYAALNRAVSHGIASTDLYPELTQQKLWNAAIQEDAAKHKVTEWEELEVYDGRPKSRGENERIFDVVATCLLLNKPVVVALGWWGHCVAYADLDYENGRFVVDGPNSWGKTWGYGNALYPGWFRLPEGTSDYTATPYEAYVPRVITA